MVLLAGWSQRAARGEFLHKGYAQHLYDLKMSGITPIIAHPERYKPIQDNVDIVERLINSGCIIQIDAGSILGHFGKECEASARLMLIKKMVHIIGSDSHSTTGKRNFCLKEAIEAIQVFLDYDINDLVNKNPQKVICGDKIIPFEIIKSKKKNIFSYFLKNKW